MDSAEPVPVTAPGTGGGINATLTGAALITGDGRESNGNGPGDPRCAPASGWGDRKRRGRGDHDGCGDWLHAVWEAVRDSRPRRDCGPAADGEVHDRCFAAVGDRYKCCDRIPRRLRGSTMQRPFANTRRARSVLEVKRHHKWRRSRVDRVYRTR